MPAQHEEKNHMIEVTFNAPKAQLANGYGHSGPNLARYLLEHGIALKTDDKPRKIGMGYGYPRMIRKLPTEVRLCFTMFESDKMPESWKEDLALATEIIVPSPFCAQTVEKLGFYAQVIPLGIEHDIWPFMERPARETFTFLSYESLNVRKGFFELFKAFTDEFKDRADVRLVLKTARTENVLPLHEYKNIEVVKGPVDRFGLLKLLYEADCFVFPSRGEGFGHTPLEALATGLPVLVPNAHGIATYYDNRFFEGLQHTPIPARYDHIKEDVGNYVRVDTHHLRTTMRHIVNHYGANHPAWYHYRRPAHEWVMSEWTYKNTAAKLAAIIKKYAS